MRQVDINTIKSNEDNPRTISEYAFATLKRSLMDFPEMLKLRPIIIDEQGVILGGNMRYLAAKELGFESIWVKEVHLSEEKKREFIIKDNSSYGEWSFHDLKIDYTSDELKGWGLHIPEWYDHEYDIIPQDPDPEDSHDYGFTYLELVFTNRDYKEVKEALKDKKVTLEKFLKEYFL